MIGRWHRRQGGGGPPSAPATLPAPSSVMKRPAAAWPPQHRGASSSTSGETTYRRFEVPPELALVLARWGPALASEMAAAAVAAGIPPSNQAHGGPRLRVGTDCSGLEVPLLALRAMGIAHEHLFSSEIKPRVREYIQANFASASSRGNPGLLLSDDMERRDHASLPYVDLYVCGFPCKPFSALHHGSRGFREKAARPFVQMLKTLQAVQPAAAVLENVLGLSRHLQKVWGRLKALGMYHVLTCEIDPAKMGEPVCRPRLYFVLIRSDVARPGVQEAAAKLLKVGLRSTCSPLTSRLLPNSSPIVSEATHSQRKRPRSSASAASQGRPQKWTRTHAEQGGAGDAVAKLDGATARQRSLYGILRAQRQRAARSAPGTPQTDRHAVDLSQGLGRTRFHDDRSPVVTPGAKIWISQLNRFMTPLEKVLIHLVPVQDLAWPRSLSDSDLADMGGNTMHAMAAGTLGCAAAGADELL